MMKNRMYQGEIPLSPRQKRNGFIVSFLVGLVIWGIFYGMAFGADANLPQDFDKGKFMRERAYESHGEYLREGETRRILPLFIYFMALSMKKQGRTPEEMTKLNLLARSMDEWYKSFDIKQYCETWYWKGLSEGSMPQSYTYVLSREDYSTLINYWYWHRQFIEMIYIDHYKVRPGFDFQTDFTKSFTIKN